MHGGQRAGGHVVRVEVEDLAEGGADNSGLQMRRGEGQTGVFKRGGTARADSFDVVVFRPRSIPHGLLDDPQLCAEAFQLGLDLGRGLLARKGEDFGRKLGVEILVQKLEGEQDAGEGVLRMGERIAEGGSARSRRLRM